MRKHLSLSQHGAISTACQHALVWWFLGNVVGWLLSIFILFPQIHLGELSYGRWVPVHLNIQLYGWTSMPLVALLLFIYRVDERGWLAKWGKAAVYGWSSALGVGMIYWLSGQSSGKIFLDWKNGSLAALMLAQFILWLVLLISWIEQRHVMVRWFKWFSLLGLIFLGMVPFVFFGAASPKVYPPIDHTTGGPTGASLLGSTLFVVGLLMLLPRVLIEKSKVDAPYGLWGYFGFSWVVFVIAELKGGTHFDGLQIFAMALLLPWAYFLPRHWSLYTWPSETSVWRAFVWFWWGLLVVSGFMMYQPGWLDRFKFTQGLVAHSHLAMAGFTTSFSALLLIILGETRLCGRWSIILWNAATLVMILLLGYAGWREGKDLSWMVERVYWRDVVLYGRCVCGAVMVLVSLYLLFKKKGSR